MKTTLTQYATALAALIAFEARYKIGERFCCVHSISDSTKALPGVTFYGDKGAPSDDRDWVLDTFGREGWEKDGESDDGWQHVSKVVDGVRVGLHAAYPIEKKRAERAVDPAAFGAPAFGEHVVRDVTQHALN